MITPQKKAYRAFATAGSFGFVMVAFILIGYYVGSYLDKRLGTDPWFLLFFLLLGIVGGFLEYLKILKGMNSDNSEKGKSDE